MSVAKRRKLPYSFSTRGTPTDSQESLRSIKIEAEHLKEKLQKSVLESPQFSKKAALLISLWIEGKARSQKSAKKT